ncbi:MAG: porin family protein [Sulfurovum sp.]|uniref:porin family protein n=1 Tax=Sulfurovum sp. TaxID=1969726 RepID=UPI003C76CD49
MKKVLLAVALSAQFTTQLFAGGDIAPVEAHEPEVMTHEAESKFYVIPKVLMIMGDKVGHGDAQLDGDRDYGYGIDIGYRLGHGFALEYDFSYSRNTVTEIEHGHTMHEAKATYYTHALDLVYTYDFTHTFGMFVKAGYEHEIEEIKDLHIDNNEDGFNYGVGMEVALNHTYKLIAEYEHATIEGPRGDSIFLGVMYNF